MKINKELFYKFRPKTISDTLILLVSIALLAFTIFYSLQTDLIYDESFTYISYVTKYRFFSTSFANNHILNTILIFISSFFFPYNEFAIRFPNLLFLVIYLFFAYKMSKRHNTLKLLVFGLLVLYSFLIPTYFGLARGYGIATALVLTLLYYFKYGGQSDKNVLLVLYLALLSLYAYVGLLPMMIAIGVYYIVDLKSEVFTFIKRNLKHLFFIFINVLYLIYFLKSVSVTGKPLYGSTMPFIQATFGDVFYRFMIDTSIVNNKFTYLIFALYLATSLFIVYKNYKKNRITFITLLTLLLYFLISTIMHKPHITGRLILPVYPLLVMSLIEILHFFAKFLKPSKLYYSISFLVFALLLANYGVFAKSKIKDLTDKNISLKNEISNKVYNNFDFSDKNKDGLWSPSSVFYRDKIFHFPPLKAMLHRFDVCTKGNASMRVYYFKDPSVLLLASQNTMHTSDRIFLHVYPENEQDLKKDRKKYGFNNLDFNWYKYNDKEMIKKLPDYPIKSIVISQKGANPWKFKITIIK